MSIKVTVFFPNLKERKLWIILLVFKTKVFEKELLSYTMNLKFSFRKFEFICRKEKKNLNVYRYLRKNIVT